MGKTAANGPVLFLRNDSPNFWMRFCLKGQGQIRLALGTSNPAEAEKLAQREESWRPQERTTRILYNAGSVS